MISMKPLIANGVKCEDYAITRCGKIWSHKRMRFLKPSMGSASSKYPKITICRNGNPMIFSVHRLVAENWVPLPKCHPDVPSKDWKRTPAAVKRVLMREMQVNHIDGNRENYAVENLEWVTGKQNISHYHSIRTTHYKR